MMKRLLMLLALATALSLSAGFAAAAEPEAAKEKPQAQKQQPIYGSQLMTRQERTEYRAKMRAAKTAEEREQIRNEHHEQMKARAKERGITLPDKPPARGRGMGRSGRMGNCEGMGAGGGMGTGCPGMEPGAGMGSGCSGTGPCGGMGAGGNMGPGGGGMEMEGKPGR